MARWGEKLYLPKLGNGFWNGFSSFVRKSHNLKKITLIVVHPQNGVIQNSDFLMP